jgi:DNA-binding PadR family transcriptional regulator
MRPSSDFGFDLREAAETFRDMFAPRGGWASGRPGGRMGRGDIRTAILIELAEEPMHGYQLIQAIETRSGGAWKPSPGSVYPTLQLLADEGLVSSKQTGERKVYTLTDTGKDAAAAVTDDTSHDSQPGMPWRRPDFERAAALPKAGAKLAQAMSQVATSGTKEQTERAVAIVDEARRKLYAILAEE